MEILRLLDQTRWIERYEVEDYRHWDGGFYYRLKIRLQNQSALFAREYVDEAERNYAFHWQDENDKMIMRWDNAPPLFPPSYLSAPQTYTRGGF